MVLRPSLLISHSVVVPEAITVHAQEWIQSIQISNSNAIATTLFTPFSDKFEIQYLMLTKTCLMPKRDNTISTFSVCP